MKNLFFISALFLSFNAFGQGQLQREATGFITYTSDKVSQLAEAIPEDKYDWRPNEETRSFAEVFAHIVSSTYFFASKLGANVPENVNLQTIEQELKTKQEIVAALKQSFDFALKAVQNVKNEDLATKATYPFPGEYTNMSSILLLMSHTNEHLGQLIAYARTNDITPPWSMQK